MLVSEWQLLAESCHRAIGVSITQIVQSDEALAKCMACAPCTVDR